MKSLLNCPVISNLYNIARIFAYSNSRVLQIPIGHADDAN